MLRPGVPPSEQRASDGTPASSVRCVAVGSRLSLTLSSVHGVVSRVGARVRAYPHGSMQYTVAVSKSMTIGDGFGVSIGDLRLHDNIENSQY